MQLLDPGPGEVWDRLTILYLKIVNRGLAGAPIDHWKAEAVKLIGQTGGLLHAGSAKARAQMDLQLELAAVNAALWQREDDLRRERQVKYADSNAEIIRIAIEIQTLNDRRAVLVSTINQLLGRPTPGEK